MGMKIYRFWNWTLVLGILCLGLVVASLAFGQEQPPKQDQPLPRGPVMRPQAGGGPMMPGMPGPGRMQGMGGPGRMRGQGVMPGMGGPGLMQGMPGMRDEAPIINLLRRPEIQKELGITPEQRQKLDDIRFTSEKEAIQHRAALQIHHLDLSRLIGSENPDRAAIDKKIQEVAQEEAALMRSSINARLNARGVLTVEQRTKLTQFMQNQMRPGRPQGEGGMQPGQPAPKPGPAKAPLPAPPAKPKAG